MRRSALPSLSDTLRATAAQLQQAGLVDAQREARLLLAALLGLDRVTLLTAGERELTATENATIADAVARRARHEPLARIVGHKEFWSLTFALNAATLVPRPDSETLIETALTLLPDKQQALHILDLGTGSGCLLLALLHEYRQAQGMGFDRAPDAVTQAQANAVALKLADRARFTVQDWNGWQPDATRYDLIVSNPPYIASAIITTLAAEVRNYDPAAALDGGADGLAAYRRLAALLPQLLAPQGIALFEIGYDQAASVPPLFAPYHTVIQQDLAGQPRCVIVRQTQEQS